MKRRFVGVAVISSLAAVTGSWAVPATRMPIRWWGGMRG